MLTAAHDGRIGLVRLVEVMCAAPARLYGLYPRKAASIQASMRNFVLVDPWPKR